MLFYFLLVLLSLCFLLVLSALPIGIFYDGDVGAFSFFGGIMFTLFLCIPVFYVWSSHSDDIGTITAQQEVISVYEQQRTDLNKTMLSFNYPSGALLNADSPVRSIVEQLANVEKLLADARAEKAKAIRSIEQRRRGPMSGVILFVGDYK